MSRSGYDTEGVYELGTFIAGIAVIIANALVGFTIFSWTWVMVLVIVISSATFFIWTGIYAQIMTFTFYGEDILFREGAFWLCLIITFAICMLPRFITKYYLHMERPFDNDIIREIVLCNKNNSNDIEQRPHTNFSPWESLKHKTHQGKTLVELEEEMPITLVRTQSDLSRQDNLQSIQQDTTTTITTTQDETMINTMTEAEYHNVYVPTEPTPAHPRIDRSGTGTSGKSEIMYMRSGKRASFTGFAYSSDDASAFDAHRKSVYRVRRRSSGSDQRHRLRNSYVDTVLTPPNQESPSHGGKEQDWMPLDGFKLRRYETEPDPHQLTKKAAPSLHWVRAVKQRMATSTSRPSVSDDHELVDISH